MAKKIVSLYINDTSLRLMVTDGRQIKEWAESPLEPGLVVNTVVMKEAEFADKIKHLLKLQEVKTKKVVVAISGFHSLTRPITLPQLPKEMLAEAVEREAERVLPVPLEQLYISWQTIPAPEEKTQVFLVALPRETADALFGALRKAGLSSSLMNLKPLLLARMVTEAAAIIVDVQTTEFDIVIVAEGVPQPIRTILFPSEAASWQDKLATISNELDRTLTFYNSNNPESTLDSTIPIFASGELADESQLCQVLSDEVGHPVLPLVSPLDSPEGFTPSQYMVNIGLTLQELSSGKEAGASAVSLNVLPAPYQPKTISLTYFLATSGAALVTVSLVSLLILTLISFTDIQDMRLKLKTTNESLQQELPQKQTLTDEIAKLEKEISVAETSRDNFSAAAASLEKEKIEIILAMEVVMESLSGNATLRSVNYADSILTISGRAPNGRVVVLYFRRLDKSGRLGEVGIKNMSTVVGKSVDFTLIGNFEKQGEVSNTGVVVNTLPSALTLTGVSSTNGALTVTVRSRDKGKVLSYIRALEATGKFSRITITSMTVIQDGEIEFSLILTGEEILEGGE